MLGHVRLLLPFRDETNTEQGAMHSKTYDPGNLLLETRTSEPVLQVAVGRMSSSSSGSDPKLAFLHPRLLSVYALQVQRGKNRESDSYSLALQYQFNLSRSAHSLVVGPFGGGGSGSGGGHRKDYLCVQSLDGTLNVFEQDTFAFSRFLPGFLLPGPIAYVERTDSFVTLSSSYQLESYRLELS